MGNKKMDAKDISKIFLLFVVIIGLGFFALLTFHSFPFDAEKPLVGSTKYHKPQVSIPGYNFNGISASARLTGELTLNNGCLYGAESLLVFPENLANWDEQSQTLTYGGQTYRLGQQIDFSGGNSKYGDGVPLIKNLSAQCRKDYVWLVG